MLELVLGPTPWNSSSSETTKAAAPRAAAFMIHPSVMSRPSLLSRSPRNEHPGHNRNGKPRFQSLQFARSVACVRHRQGASAAGNSIRCRNSEISFEITLFRPRFSYFISNYQIPDADCEILAEIVKSRSKFTISFGIVKTRVEFALFRME